MASKAARIVTAARGRTLIDFGTRRGHGPHAGLLAARASYIAGFDGTSNVEAARLLGIPASGTMAHSWVQSFDSEEEAFAAYARAFPGATTLLVDTYDTLEGVRKAAAIVPPIQAIRLDSGDLASLARGARTILDQHDRPQVKIMASGDLDENEIARLIAASAPIDGFGVGTELITSRDAPALSMVYKLVEIDGEGRIKLSPGKKTYPMAKQVYRRRDASGTFRGDLVTRADETAEGEPLLVDLVRRGHLVQPAAQPGGDPRIAAQISSPVFPRSLRALMPSCDYPIEYSDLLEADARRLMEQENYEGQDLRYEATAHLSGEGRPCRARPRQPDQPSVSGQVGVSLRSCARRDLGRHLGWSPTVSSICWIRTFPNAGSPTMHPWESRKRTMPRSRAVPLSRGELRRGRFRSKCCLISSAARGIWCATRGLVVGSQVDPESILNPQIRALALEGRLFRSVLADISPIGWVLFSGAW